MSRLVPSEIANKLNDVIRQNVRNQLNGVGKDVKILSKTLEDVGGNLDGEPNPSGIGLNLSSDACH